MVQKRVYRPIESGFLVDMFREAKGIQHGEGNTGVGEFRFWPSAPWELLTPPTTVAVLDFQKVTKRVLQSTASCVAESTENSGRRCCRAGVQCAAWPEAIAAVVSRRFEDELQGTSNRLVSTSHPQLVEYDQRGERTEWVTDAESAVGAGPIVSTIVMPPGKDGVDIGDVSATHHTETEGGSGQDACLLL